MQLTICSVTPRTIDFKFEEDPVKSEWAVHILYFALKDTLDKIRQHYGYIEEKFSSQAWEIYILVW